MLSNTHIHRFPSLAITAIEMNEYGVEYATQIVKNAIIDKDPIEKVKQAAIEFKQQYPNIHFCTSQP